MSRYLAEPEAPRYKRREPRPTKLGPFEDYVRRRLLEAAPARMCAPAMLRELRALGYSGGLRQLQGFMRECRPAERPDPVVRFETAPGQQLQVDFVTFRRGRDPLYAFTAVLGFSRYRWGRFVTDEGNATLLGCHERLFDHLGGVSREVLYDNPKTIVLVRDAYGIGQHRYHPQLLDFAKAYGFTIRLCRPYRARTKGKVERFHRYLRRNFFVPLDSRLQAAGIRLDASTANAEVGGWLREVANQRIHAVTGQAPATLFETREQLALRPLPAHKRPISQPERRSLPLTDTLQHPLSVYQQLLTAVRA